MTNGPTPTPPPRNEAEHARKLALAILSTLEKKGLLTELDVDTILHAAYRSASAAPQVPETPQPDPSQPATSAPANPAPPPGPAALGTRWVQASVTDTAGSVTPDRTSVDHTVAAPAPAEPAAQAAAPQAEKPSLKPMVIDFTLD
ncbi:hypothetical protein [Deinococcus sp.]|uniref:hypothetical protein n=1 Tax=Deinococcus sp. TaxID=47478 RepID=UPI0025C3701A|nr:hypothetical protein [Deinococcus sp.]